MELLRAANRPKLGPTVGKPKSQNWPSLKLSGTSSHVFALQDPERVWLVLDVSLPTAYQDKSDRFAVDDWQEEAMVATVRLMTALGADSPPDIAVPALIEVCVEVHWLTEQEWAQVETPPTDMGEEVLVICPLDAALFTAIQPAARVDFLTAQVATALLRTNIGWTCARALEELARHPRGESRQFG